MSANPPKVNHLTLSLRPLPILTFNREQKLILLGINTSCLYHKHDKIESVTGNHTFCIIITLTKMSIIVSAVAKYTSGKRCYMLLLK